ncbi:hypothetical protein AFL94_17045 [Arthrobacter sp. LS16]|nr:hypothetical protein AFL94_17045 [Arthrobacter sp. LS16]
MLSFSLNGVYIPLLNPGRSTAAELRARPLMTPERAKEVIAPERPATGVEWLTAAEKNATSKPTVKLMTEHHEQDTIAVTATWQWVTKDEGILGRRRETNVLLHLHRHRTVQDPRLCVIHSMTVFTVQTVCLV